MQTRHIDTALLRELAVAASCDPRSIRRRLRGDVVRGVAGHRIEAVLAERGLLPAPQPAAKSA